MSKWQTRSQRHASRQRHALLTGERLPPRCNQEVFERGEHVWTLHSIPGAKIERLIKKIAKRSGQRVDWHFVGGRAVVRYLGDRDRVVQAIEHFKPEFQRLYNAAVGPDLEDLHPKPSDPTDLFGDP